MAAFLAVKKDRMACFRFKLRYCMEVKKKSSRRYHPWQLIKFQLSLCLFILKKWKEEIGSYSIVAFLWFYEICHENSVKVCPAIEEHWKRQKNWPKVKIWALCNYSIKAICALWPTTTHHRITWLTAKSWLAALMYSVHSTVCTILFA